MDLQTVITDILDPAAKLLPARMDTSEARLMLLTIGQQESEGFQHRRQLIKTRNGLEPVGPAKSFWQGEKGGGMVHGVRVHAASKAMAAEVYKARGVEPTDQAIWDAIEHDDILAACCARLLLWTDPKPLPAVHDAAGAWNLYALRTWRPGRPHPQTWASYHLASRRALGIAA